MNNLTALKRLCNAIANTFYPDNGTLELVLFNAGIDAQASAQPKDVELFRLAARLVFGYVEQSRSENSVSTSVNYDAIKESLAMWCNEYGVDADEILPDAFRVMYNGSNLW